MFINRSRDKVLTCSQSLWLDLVLWLLNATFNNISVTCIYHGGQFFWCMKPEAPEKTTDLSQVTDKLYHTMEYTSPWSRFELTSVVIGTDFIGIMIRKFKQWWPTFPPISIKQTALLTSNHWTQKRPQHIGHTNVIIQHCQFCHLKKNNL